ncbi:NADH-quinone oxidoreductase subunit C [Streptomyces sp. NPDC059618]|uniref:NADH-quinone oxidoreductase subunit C n=1 Tax=Streptomyces sp. NPDC059618 TaxID=3346887 RepID=UPI0036C9C117
MTVGWLPGPAEDLFGPDATAEESYEVLTVDVPPASWTAALETARDTLGCTYFDWLSAVDEPGTGFRVSAHVVALSPLHRLLVRTTVPHTAPVLPSAVSVYAGAAWHERETHEMFGVTFEGHPGLDPLLLPEGFEGHPLRKDFVLAARVAKAWPGAKEPGESEHGGPKRRQMLPPGVPDPNEWGPLKGQLPPAPSRPARGAARPAGDRPVRRTRTAGEGSASQAPAAAADAGAGASGTAEGVVATGAASGAEGARPARRSRSVSQGSASQRTEQPQSPTPTPTPASPAAESEPTPATEPAASPEPAAPAGASRAAEPGPATGPARRPAAPRSSDAPWHQPKPAFDDTARERDQARDQKPEPTSETESEPTPETGSEPTPEAGSEPTPATGAEPTPEAVSESEQNPEAVTESGPNPEAVSESGPNPESGPKPEPDPEQSDPSPEDPPGGPQ